jgi:hypothetical protein
MMMQTADTMLNLGKSSLELGASSAVRELDLKNKFPIGKVERTVET